MILAPDLIKARTLFADAGPAPNPAHTMTIRDSGWMFIDMEWVDESGKWNDPCILQRSTDGTWPTVNLAAAQDIDTNFIWVGIREANRYIDLGLTANTTYEYRACYVTNYDAVTRAGATATYTDWQYGGATTDAISETNYNVVTDFGADNTGATNSWAAFQSAFSTIRGNANKCNLRCPAGTYLIYPTDPAVTWDGSYLKVTNGQTFAGAFITGDMSNTVIYGDVDGSGNPTTFFTCRLWANRPGTDFLTVLKNAGGNPAVDSDIYQGPSGTDEYYGIKRYSFWRVDEGVENIELKDVDIDMTSNPVSTGKRWYTFDELRYQWDISQKLVRGNDVNARNILLTNVRARNIRGEIAYWGGLEFSGKFKLVDCVFSQSNSSITSMSAGVEFENCTFSDFSNAGVENSPHSLSGDNATGSQLVSTFNGLAFYQDSIIRGCTFNCLDQSVSGVMKDLSDLATAENAFSGIHIFNQVGTFQTVTDCTVENFGETGIAPWYECFNAFYNNITIENPTDSSGAFLSVIPKAESLYKLSGGMDYVYLNKITFDMGTSDMGNGGGLIKNFSNINCQDNYILDNIVINGNGQTATRIIQDQHTNASGRANYKMRDWSVSSLSTDEFSMFINLNNPDSTLPLPLYEDFAALWHAQTVSGTSSSLEVEWGQTKIQNNGETVYSITGISNLDKHKVGSYLKFRPYNTGHTITFQPNSSWNNFSQSYSITSSQVLTCRVVTVGSNKLQYVSLA